MKTWAVSLLGLALALAGRPVPEEPGPVRLDADLPVATWYTRDTRSAVTELIITVPAGIHAVSPNLRGLALLTARVALEIPSAGEVRDLMEMGTRLSSWVTGDLAVLSMSVLSSHFEASLKILAGMLHQPLATGIRIQRIKEWMEDREDLERDSPRAVMVRYMTDHFLASRGYGGSANGCRQTRSAIRREHVLDFWASHYTRDKMRLAVVTDLDASKVTSLLRRYLKTLPAGGAATATGAPVAGNCPVADGRIQRDLSQPLLAWGMPLPALSAGNPVMAKVLARHLARGVGSLAWSLRGRFGLAYTVDCEVSQHADGGILTVFLRTSPENVTPARDRMENILNELIVRGITRSELEALVKLETVAWFRSLESKRERAWRMASYAQDARGAGWIRTVPERLAALTPEGINGYIRQILSPRARCFRVVGAPDRFSRKQEKIR